MNSKNLLHEFIEKGYDLEQLRPYEDFLIECSKKDYSNFPTHKHHILPKCMNEGKYANDTIILSLLDHFNSHLILANCFEFNTDERRKNLSACKYINIHIKRYMKKMNFEVPVEFKEFWDLAHEIMKDFNKGENNLFYGKKHSEESKIKIREKRKFQIFSEETIERNKQRLRTLPNTQKGEANPNFGKTFDEIFGKEKSLSIREKLKLRIQERKINKPLPDGIFKCYEIVGGQLKLFYRFCPNDSCEQKIYYKGNNEFQPGQSIMTAHRDHRLCSECRNELKYKEVNIPERKISYCISNRLIVKDLRSGIIYDSCIDTMRQLKLPDGKFRKLLKEGILEIVENKSSWNTRRLNKEFAA